MHTHSRRYTFSPSKLESEFGLPLTNSRATTPNENISAFSVRCPRMAYSGARYPLHHKNEYINSLELFKTKMNSNHKNFIWTNFSIRTLKQVCKKNEIDFSINSYWLMHDLKVKVQRKYESCIKLSYNFNSWTSQFHFFSAKRSL